MITIAVKFQKNKNYPRPHDAGTSWSFSLEGEDATMHPVVHYDEGLGITNAYEANPEHANFTQSAGSSCYPESTVDNIFAKLEVSLTKGALETDKLHVVKFAVLRNYTQFEDQAAVDELTSATIATILELQQESTDRQAFALYTGTKMPEKYTNSSLLAAEEEGLTTNQKIESVNFDPYAYYDSIHYYTIAGKMKACQGGLKWYTLTKNKPFVNIPIHIHNKVKSMKQYAQESVMIYVPNSGSYYQIPIATDTTAINHVDCIFSYRYNEWNRNYNMERS